MPRKPVKKIAKPIKLPPEEYKKRLEEIYKTFHLKAAEIGLKNFQIFESAMKKVDYLQMTHLLSQIKSFGH